MKTPTNKLNELNHNKKMYLSKIENLKIRIANCDDLIAYYETKL